MLFDVLPKCLFSLLLIASFVLLKMSLKKLEAERRNDEKRSKGASDDGSKQLTKWQTFCFFFKSHTLLSLFCRPQADELLSQLFSLAIFSLIVFVPSLWFLFLIPALLITCLRVGVCICHLKNRGKQAREKGGNNSSHLLIIFLCGLGSASIFVFVSVLLFLFAKDDSGSFEPFLKLYGLSVAIDNLGVKPLCFLILSLMLYKNVEIRAIVCRSGVSNKLRNECMPTNESEAKIEDDLVLHGHIINKATNCTPFSQDNPTNHNILFPQKYPHKSNLIRIFQNTSKHQSQQNWNSQRHQEKGIIPQPVFGSEMNIDQSRKEEILNKSSLKYTYPKIREDILSMFNEVKNLSAKTEIRTKIESQMLSEQAWKQRVNEGGTWRKNSRQKTSKMIQRTQRGQLRRRDYEISIQPARKRTTQIEVRTWEGKRRNKSTNCRNLPIVHELTHKENTGVEKHFQIAEHI